MSLSDEALVGAVRQLAAESPDYVYVNQKGVEAGNGASCFYVHTKDGELVGGCLIGQAAIRVGVPIADVAEWDDDDSAGADTVLPDSISDGVRDWATRVQKLQDVGNTWGFSVRDADRTVGDPLA